MPSQPVLIWAGAAAATVVAAAGVGAFVWTHPDTLWGDDPALVAARAAAPAAAPAPPPVAAPTEPAATPTDAKPAEQTAALEKPPPQAVKPAFDVVTVEPTGEAVIAGRAAPNAKVALMDQGKSVAEVTADATGQFVIIPSPLTPGSHSLSLATGGGDAARETSDAVAVSVAEPAAKTVVASAPAAKEMLAPAAPATQTLATSSPADGSRIAIQSVEAGADGGLVARGSTDPNADLRLYLNGATIAEAKAKTDGRWSLTIRRGVAPGAYVVRAEEMNGVKVVASAEMRFDYPTMPGALVKSGGLAEPAPPLAPTAQTSAFPETAPADVVIEAIQTAQVVPGHTLWALSQNYYGDPTRYPLIYEANKAQIHNPNLIFPGQVFVVPKSQAKP
jgi:nucleoid-associated protein YgaU